jgi:hypothetical protein
LHRVEVNAGAACAYYFVPLSAPQPAGRRGGRLRRSAQAQTKTGSSLYGGGLAKLKKGDTASSEADIAGAKAIQANVAEKFARYGVTPSAATAR